MQLHMISPSCLKQARLLPPAPNKGVKEFMGAKVVGSVGPTRVSYRVLATLCLLAAFVLFRSAFLLSAAIHEEEAQSNYSNNKNNHRKNGVAGCLGRKIGRILHHPIHDESNPKVPQVIYQVLEEPMDQILGTQMRLQSPLTLEDFIADQYKGGDDDAKTFALKLKAMVSHLEETARAAKIQEYLYRHVASNSIPKELSCVLLALADEHSTNSGARRQLPPPELVPALVDTASDLFHFVVASDNVVAAAVVAASLVGNSLRPHRVVLHVITDRKTYSAMHAWFSLHPLRPAIIEVKGLHHFDWLTKGKVPILEAMEKDEKARSGFRGGSSAIMADHNNNDNKNNKAERPKVVAAKLQALSPKYHSPMNHIRIYLPQLFPSLSKVVFLDDDVVVQTDMSPLWEIDMGGKVNGAVETCRGDDKFVMSKRFKNYLNFSQPLIEKSFDPDECAWAYGMNIFDLEAWRRTNITQTYHYWLEENLKSELSLWQLGTLPPGLIAFRGHVHAIDPFWHMLGLGYQQNTSIAQAERAGVIHFNGRAKPWLDIAFPQLRPLWTKYLDFSDTIIQRCHFRRTP
ncbi:unnamed protein product [Cuscuta campestris]|uniref:Hexosyltransferase n=1 Tax=Cuscuta campestris TaxID=132261 RepID=A0A484MS99_9ASTE|nr:unnamed protein product [Cuscuta campestris]